MILVFHRALPGLHLGPQQRYAGRWPKQRRAVAQANGVVRKPGWKRPGHRWLVEMTWKFCASYLYLYPLYFNEEEDDEEEDEDEDEEDEDEDEDDDDDDDDDDNSPFFWGVSLGFHVGSWGPTVPADNELVFPQNNFRGAKC